MTNETLINKSLKFAEDFHRGQFRKGAGRLPYIIHPLKVVERLGLWGITWEDYPQMIAAAFLHDVLEDVPLEIASNRSDTIRFDLGDDVVNLVRELTFWPEFNTKDKYLESFLSKSIDSVLIKVADRLCNVEDFDRDPETSNYALKYFKKAKSLLKTLHARESEVVDKFGQQCYNRILWDIGYTQDGFTGNS